MHRHDSAAAAAAGLLASVGLIGFPIGFAAFVISVIAMSSRKRAIAASCRS